MNLQLDFDGRRLRGARPFAVLEAKNGRVSTRWLDGEPAWPLASCDLTSGDALATIQQALRWARANVSTRGAAIGFVGYDAARQIEPRAFAATSPADALNLPDLRLVFCKELQEYFPTQIEPPRTPAFPASSLQPPASAEYLAAVKRIQEYIAAGDIYQANFTQRFAALLPCAPADLYERLQASHAVPFGALLEWDDFAIVSNSPERFLTLRGRELLAQPIKGTARRGSTSEEDEALREALRHSAKDRAENVMIVDLLRNDLGRVCEWGSVRVPELCKVQSFPTLHHLVSSVTGTLRAELDGVDAFRAAFPCGSITGAPKIRAMQIIDELEPARRGVAMGALGYFGFDSDMEWNVAIRTLTCVNGHAFYHVGGGIVADSTPESEHAEMLLKAQAMRRALGVP